MDNAQPDTYPLPNTRDYFGPQPRFADWVTRNCRLCRYSIEPAPWLSPHALCPLTSTLIPLYFRNAPITPSLLGIVDSYANILVRERERRAPHYCCHRKDNRGRR